MKVTKKLSIALCSLATVMAVGGVGIIYVAFNPQNLQVIDNTSSRFSLSALFEDKEIVEYLERANSYSESHSNTVKALTLFVGQINEKSEQRVQFRRENLAGLRGINTLEMTTDELLSLVRSKYTVPPEVRDELSQEASRLEGLLVRVKQDQVSLSQFTPPTSVPTDFHALALTSIEQESALIVSLLNFYYSPELEKRGPKFKEFLTKISEAESRSSILMNNWSKAQDELRALETGL